jgi:hypothetical protein
MMMSKGKRPYVPPFTLEQLDNIKINYKMEKQCDAFKKMASLSQLGMEVEKMSGYYYIENKFNKKRK